MKAFLTLKAFCGNISLNMLISKEIESNMIKRENTW
jgi:hypothetical protein